MKTLKLAILAVLLVAGLSGCENKVDTDKLRGNWYEAYDPDILALDTGVLYSFDGNNHFRVHSYDFLTEKEWNENGTYLLNLEEGTITLNPIMSDDSSVTYKIVTLTSWEMEWQKVGTTYSQNGWESDYRHFKRSADN